MDALSKKGLRHSAFGFRLSAGVLIVLLVFGNSVRSENRAVARVMITLRPQTRTLSDVVRIVDVADLSGGDEALRERIAALDLDDAPAASESLDISPRQIEFRLRLAGVDPRLVSIRGSTLPASTNKLAKAQTVVQLASQSRTANMHLSTEQAVLAAVQACLKKQLPWPEEDIVVQLVQPLPRELRDSPTSATFSAEWRSTGTPLGRITLQIVRQVTGQRTLEVALPFEVRHFEKVLVTSQPIARGQVIVASDLEFGRQDVTQLTGFSSSSDQLVGQKAKRILPAAHVLKTGDLEPVVRVVGPPIVKRLDRVKVIAHSGALHVEMAGEAQKEGRAGDVIKVKNIHSNALISARVLSASEVEVVD